MTWFQLALFWSTKFPNPRKRMPARKLGGSIAARLFDPELLDLFISEAAAFGAEQFATTFDRKNGLESPSTIGFR